MKDPIRRDVGCLGAMCIPFSSADRSKPGLGLPHPPPKTGFSGPPSCFFACEQLKSARIPQG